MFQQMIQGSIFLLALYGSCSPGETLHLRFHNRNMKSSIIFRGGSRRVAKFLQESILIAFDFTWKVLLSDRNFAKFLDPPFKRSGFFYLFDKNLSSKSSVHQLEMTFIGRSHSFSLDARFSRGKNDIAICLGFQEFYIIHGLILFYLGLKSKRSQDAIDCFIDFDSWYRLYRFKQQSNFFGIIINFKNFIVIQEFRNNLVSLKI